MLEQQVRELDIDDLSEIVNRMRDAGFEAGWNGNIEFNTGYVADQVAMMLSSDDWLVIGSEDVGAVFIANIDSTWFTPSLHAFEMFFYVHPDLRNRGYMQELISRYVKWAESKGAVKINIGVNLGINNQIGNYLCGKCGFERSGLNFVRTVEK